MRENDKRMLTGAFLGMALWQIHASLMIVGTILIFVGILISRYMKGKSWWLVAHKYIEITGFVISSIGIATAFYLVSTYADKHFRYIHGIIGLVAVVLIAITAALGFLQFVYTSKIKLIKKIHRWSGRIGFTLMVTAILLGLDLVGVF